MFVQDSWKLRPGLTLNYGFRLENQYPFHFFNNTYTRPGYAGLYGVSGTNGLFQPGASGGAVPSLSPVTGDTTGYSPTHFPSPTVGVAYQLPKASGPLSWMLGKGGHSVLRGGFRDRLRAGAVQHHLERQSGCFEQHQHERRRRSRRIRPAFGPAGSVLFSNANLPVANVASTPTYPIPLTPGNTISDYDPNLKSRYVESWQVGLQRPIREDTVLEVRYVGNRSARAWTSLNLNEINPQGGGFLDQFIAAQNNLAIANGVPVLAAHRDQFEEHQLLQHGPGRTERYSANHHGAGGRGQFHAGQLCGAGTGRRLRQQHRGEREPDGAADRRRISGQPVPGEPGHGRLERQPDHQPRRQHLQLLADRGAAQVLQGPAGRRKLYVVALADHGADPDAAQSGRHYGALGLRSASRRQAELGLRTAVGAGPEVLVVGGQSGSAQGGGRLADLRHRTAAAIGHAFAIEQRAARLTTAATPASCCTISPPAICRA